MSAIDSIDAGVNALQTDNNSKKMWAYRIANVTAAVASIFRGISRTFTLIPHLARDAAPGNHAITGVVGISHVCTIYLGVHALTHSNALGDTEGVTNAKSLILSGTLALLGTMLQTATIFIIKCIGTIVVGIGAAIAASALLSCASVCNLINSIYHLKLCIELSNTLKNDPRSLIKEWNTLINDDHYNANLECELKKLERRIGMNGLKILVDHKKRLQEWAAAAPLPEGAQEFIQQMQHEVLKQKLFYGFGITCSVLGLGALIFAEVASWGTFALITPLILSGVVILGKVITSKKENQIALLLEANTRRTDAPQPEETSEDLQNLWLSLRESNNLTNRLLT